jgi:1,2-dihydroxy-3-keto-5-methylthiopentene dioxygenase
MAIVTVRDSSLRIDAPGGIREFLQPFGIWHERWEVEGRLDAEATGDEILTAYAPEIERLQAAGGYVTADVINVSPDTPNLQTMLDRFNKEHTHSEDEVRFIVRGRGVFHVNPVTSPVFAIEVEAGDLINVPAGTRHWFDLCADRTIRAIRLFLDPAGWTPEYLANSAHATHAPLCWGPAYVPPERASTAAVRLAP